MPKNARSRGALHPPYLLPNWCKCWKKIGEQNESTWPWQSQAFWEHEMVNLWVFTLTSVYVKTMYLLKRSCTNDVFKLFPQYIVSTRTTSVMPPASQFLWELLGQPSRPTFTQRVPRCGALSFAMHGGMRPHGLTNWSCMSWWHIARFSCLFQNGRAPMKPDGGFWGLLPAPQNRRACRHPFVTPQCGSYTIEILYFRVASW